MVVILSEVVVREADDNAVEEPAPSEAEGTSCVAEPCGGDSGSFLLTL
jgi:hypothetical protein